MIIRFPVPVMTEWIVEINDLLFWYIIGALYLWIIISYCFIKREERRKEFGKLNCIAYAFVFAMVWPIVIIFLAQEMLEDERNIAELEDEIERLKSGKKRKMIRKVK